MISLVVDFRESQGMRVDSFWPGTLIQGNRYTLTARRLLVSGIQTIERVGK